LSELLSPTLAGQFRLALLTSRRGSTRGNLRRDSEIRKEAFVREEVRVKKVVEQDTVEAQETIRREELDVTLAGNPLLSSCPTTV